MNMFQIPEKSFMIINTNFIFRINNSKCIIYFVKGEEERGEKK